jgi:hypothetical protein
LSPRAAPTRPSASRPAIESAGRTDEAFGLAAR